MVSAPKRGRVLARNIVPAHEVIERVMQEGSDEELALFSELAQSDEEGESDEGELYIPGVYQARLRKKIFAESHFLTFFKPIVSKLST